MSPPDPVSVVRKKRRRRRRRAPVVPLVVLLLLAVGLFWAIRELKGLRPSGSRPEVPTGFVSDVGVLRAEFTRYYGKPAGDPAVEDRFRQAGALIVDRDYPGAAALLETLGKEAALPVVFTDLGVVYYFLTDYTRAADAFREALARESAYAPARQFLRTAHSLAAGSADPYTREVEPNNDFRAATLIPLNVPVGGDIAASGDDQDYFRIIAPPAPRDLVTVDVGNHSIGFAPRIHVYDADLRLSSWGEKTARPGESVQVTGGPPPNAPIYVAISSANAQSGQYVVTVKPQKAFDAYEPNDEIMSAHLIHAGEEIDANIMDADDTDFYSFESPRKGTVDIEIRNRSTALIPAITIYNMDRAKIGFGPEIRKPGGDLRHTIEVEKGKTYYLQVWSQGGTAGGYSLRIN